MTITPNLRTDADRLWRTLEDMARIGPGCAGGNDRQALTDADGAGRRLFARWCAEAGLAVDVDSIGNMFATRPGTRPDEPAIYLGSHLDTQPTGGRYDGVLGVLGALEVIRSLDDLGIATRRSIVVTNWTNEEGSRFTPAMLGSGVFAGLYDEAWAKAQTDGAGIAVGDALRRIGFEGDSAPGARRIGAYLELHIEQGPVLEEEGIDIGVVTHGQGLYWLRVTLTGQESHAGSTPMARRRDAGLAMARVGLAVHSAAMRCAPHAVGTLGHVELFPNSPNIVAGRAVATIDIRSPDAATLAAMKAAIEDDVAAIAAAAGLSVLVEDAGHFAPVTFDPGCVAAVARAADGLGLTRRDIVSGAGHDACFINGLAPTAMVMCPCVGGLSHNEAEAITKEWARNGADTLLNAALELAGIDGIDA